MGVGWAKTEEERKQRRAAAKARWAAKHPEQDRAIHDLWMANNRDKMRASSRKHYRANKARLNAASRHKNRKRKYGITKEQYEALLESQGHTCAICANPETATRNGKVKSLAVDHDHLSGRIRGLLCAACNTMLGSGQDDPELLGAAIAYLERAPIGYAVLQIEVSQKQQIREERSTEEVQTILAQWAVHNPGKVMSAALRHYYKNALKINAEAVHKNRKRKLGIIKEQYEALLELQGHVCAICKKPETTSRKGEIIGLAGDHDHRTSKVRGLLCMACNTMIGKSRDNPEILRAAIVYLGKPLLTESLSKVLVEGCDAPTLRNP